MKTNRTPRVALARSLPPLKHSSQYDYPCFELTFICSGRTFKALARGKTPQSASHEGLIALASQIPDFEPEAARLVGAVQMR